MDTNSRCYESKISYFCTFANLRRLQLLPRVVAWTALVAALLSTAVPIGAVGQTADTLEAEVERLLQLEPGVRETQEAAVRAAGLDVHPGRDWGRAARRSAALPVRVAIDATVRDLREVRGELTRTEELDLELAPESTGWRELVRDDDAVALEAGLLLEWDLRGLAWSRDEAWAVREALELAERRTERMLEVADVYFQRRAALALYLDPTAAEEERLSARIAFEGYTAALDAWTDGWFSTQCGLRAPRSAAPDGVAR